MHLSVRQKESFADRDLRELFPWNFRQKNVNRSECNIIIITRVCPEKCSLVLNRPSLLPFRKVISSEEVPGGLSDGASVLFPGQTLEMILFLYVSMPRDLGNKALPQLDTTDQCLCVYCLLWCHPELELPSSLRSPPRKSRHTCSFVLT